MGEMYHMHGPLEPAEGDVPSYAQLYFYDPAQANSARMGHRANGGLDLTILTQLLQMVETDCNNPWIKMYKTAHERLQQAHEQDEELQITLNPQLQLIVQAGAD
ncbi:uncharacterized protein BDR25DRAFT_319562 [Lindgomyces ingoldianus]|uniref:Uncharacterized protein n=1 Tax=Lindgomyces ingoldianus TaxID=673940 RepID=A0ACB6QBS8_9PLEO|nr:uncharacterized protein BDR25DRAFT_319562 [Lindgomyces ingoldianus]KAF2463960.1 hypothetical protein BDR25DRAFT_319562 [Lindgomyces ingoldianus]